MDPRIYGHPLKKLGSMDVYFPSHMAQGNDPSPSGMFKVFKTFSWGNHRLTGAIMERKWILVDYTGTQLLLYIYIYTSFWLVDYSSNEHFILMDSTMENYIYGVNHKWIHVGEHLISIVGFSMVCHLYIYMVIAEWTINMCKYIYIYIYHC